MFGIITTHLQTHSWPPPPLSRDYWDLHFYFCGIRKKEDCVSILKYDFKFNFRYLKRDRTIVHIRRRLGNLNKTYLGHPRLPKFGCLCVNPNPDVWTSSIQLSATARSNISSCQFLNRHCQRISEIIRSHLKLRLDRGKSYL